MTAAPTPRLVAADVTVRYGSTVALQAADVELCDGESVAVTGPSGSGKTTLLHALTGVITPQQGAVRFRTEGGVRDLAALPGDTLAALRLSGFGFIFQHGLLIPELTVTENVAPPLLLTGVAREPAIARAEAQLPRFGIDGLGARRIGQLSGGQAQRVSIARATVTHAPVIAADEPTGSLDSANSAAVMDLLLKEAVEREGRLLIVVTHDERIAARCDRRVRVFDRRVQVEE